MNRTDRCTRGMCDKLAKRRGSTFTSSVGRGTRGRRKSAIHFPSGFSKGVCKVGDVGGSVRSKADEVTRLRSRLRTLDDP